MVSEFTFELLANDGLARLGIVHTKRGQISTPAFMPVGTAATVKAMKPEHVAETGADILLCNTYHLMLRPGSDCVRHFGGLHGFMNWKRPILTDSGGFQVMSLKSMRTISEHGVRFKSHLDGSMHELTPERSMAIQNDLASDIVMCFDECTPYPANYETARTSMELSMRWAKRCRECFRPNDGRALFGIQQGSVFRDLREQSSNNLQEIDFDGYAVGGLAVGEGQDIMFEVLDYAPSMLSQNKPRYLMGVGKPDDIIGAVARGIDMFDCVLPTRSGRTAQAFTSRGTINIRNSRHSRSKESIDKNCSCPICQCYSRGYIHHLFKSRELLGYMLLTEHNLYFYQSLMAKIRNSIKEGNFTEFSKKYLSLYLEGEHDSGES